MIEISFILHLTRFQIDGTLYMLSK